MRAMIWMVGALLMFATQAASLGCSSSASTVSCDETSCECTDRTNCDLDCMDIVACEPTCVGIDDTCQATCTAEDCEFRCLSAERCEGLCGDNCLARCSGSQGSCRVDTGNDSEFECTNFGTCAADIGDGSVTTCLNVESCNVRCVGDCDVFCLLTETCTVQCAEGEPLDCGEGHHRCGIACP